MTAETLYSSGQAAKAAGISAGSLRNYTQGGRFGRFYAPYLSAGAAPAPGQPRQFTASDVAVLRYIRSRTAQGASHETIAAELAAGALEAFAWQPPEESAAQVREARAAQEAAQGVDGWGQPTRQPEAAQPAALVVMAETLTAELAAARQREQILWDRIVEAETRAARAEGALEAVTRAQGRGFWRRLFGG